METSNRGPRRCAAPQGGPPPRPAGRATAVLGLLPAAFFWGCVLLTAAAPAGALAAETGQRFILFNAEYNSSLKQISKTTVFLEKRLFKLDTRTGETWVLVDVLQDGEDIRYWKKITDLKDRQ